MPKPRLCACGCGSPCTGRYSVKRGHGSLIPAAERPWLQEYRARAQRERLAHSDVPAPITKPRTCLQCDQFFSSWGPGNRQCSHCRELAQMRASQSGSPEPIRGRLRGAREGNGWAV